MAFSRAAFRSLASILAVCAGCSLWNRKLCLGADAGAGWSSETGFEMLSRPT